MIKDMCILGMGLCRFLLDVTLKIFSWKNLWGWGGWVTGSKEVVRKVLSYFHHSFEEGHQILDVAFIANEAIDLQLLELSQDKSC